MQICKGPEWASHTAVAAVSPGGWRILLMLLRIACYLHLAIAWTSLELVGRANAYILLGLRCTHVHRTVALSK